MSGTSHKATLLIDSSERDSDLLWVSGFHAGDPFTFTEVNGTSFLILSDLELGRGRKDAKVDTVVSYSELERELEKKRGRGPVGIEDVAVHFLRRQGVETVRVPARFPVRAADRLREEGFTLVVSKEPFFPRRAVKTPEEILRIEAAQEATEEVMLDAIEQIRRTEIRGDELHLDGETLTAERLKMRVRKLLLERGYNVGEIIVAPGDQGCDPHNTGSGPLRAGETIIIDIFPRHIENRYWGDMTRTVVKGEPSSELRKLHAAVEKAQRVALEEIGPGVRGADVHRKVSESLEMDGFATTCTNGTWKGFFHGTGHGVGLDIHEAPRLSKNGPVLEEGMVVTVEPGLYYPGLGGVRIEDLVVITADGCRNLNRASRELVV